MAVQNHNPSTSLNKKELSTNKHDELNKLIGSKSDNEYFQKSNLKSLVPQIVAAVIVQCYNLLSGLSYAYSAILIPQLQTAQKNSSNFTDVIQVTESESAWIASVLLMVCPATSIISGVCVDKIGRLNVFKISAIPNCIGWGLIATAKSVSTIIIGRVLCGISMSLGTTSAMVYVTEIGEPSIRGLLLSLSPLIASIGTLLGYLHGWCFTWRIYAWFLTIYTACLTAVVALFLSESPVWLISKNKINDAEKSLAWFNRYSIGKNEIASFINKKITALQYENQLKQQLNSEGRSSTSDYLKMFSKRTVYRPLLILSFLYVFHSMSGLYMTLFYAISFFEDVGSTVDPYLASICMASIRSVMSCASLWLIKKYNRRPLILISTAGMAICMAISGYFTKLISEGSFSHNWVPILMILLYTFSTTIGFLSIPLTMMAELFPLSVRGITHSITFGVFNVGVFISVQMYYDIKRLFGGSSGLQCFFAVMSLGGFVYCYVLLPETQNKELSEIEEYFDHHSTFLSNGNRQSFISNESKTSQHYPKKCPSEVVNVQ